MKRVIRTGAVLIDVIEALSSDNIHTRDMISAIVTRSDKRHIADTYSEICGVEVQYINYEFVVTGKCSSKYDTLEIKLF